MLTYCDDFQATSSYAIFFNVCDLGSLRNYKHQWHAQQKLKNGSSDGIPEITLMKMMRDVSLGLDFLHNSQSTGYVHNDLKPDNILVVTPPDYTAGDIPAEPIFKITDFGCSTKVGEPKRHRGTYEFAPPEVERKGPLKPSIDIWALGATIQQFALDLRPTESRETVIRRLQLEKKSAPDPNNNKEWGTDHWRGHRYAIYRPINATYQQLRDEYDVPAQQPEFYRSYSDNLNIWHSMMMRLPAKFRVTSAFLAKIVVPCLEKHMVIERKMAKAKKHFDTAVELIQVSENIKVYEERYKDDIEWFQREQPEYEGDGYDDRGFVDASKL
jgi:serine/threonine protein kinase